MIASPSRRDDLFQELRLLSRCYTGFPRLWDTYLPTTQANRIVLLLDGQGSEAAPSPIFDGVEWLRVSDLEAPIALFVDDDGYVSSTKVLESLTIYLSGVEGYQAATLEAATATITLTLKTATLEPFLLGLAVPVYADEGTLSYYLLPNGTGNWRRVTVAEIEQL
ncbi:MAG: hypothetical protein F6K00_27190 [Leptolyngbya sp. SIOISBB]|nr:hypothetical protein [Leptolyngbya sp. SIOISBB]